MTVSNSVSYSASAMVRDRHAGARPPQQRHPSDERILTTKNGLHIPEGLSFSEWKVAGRRLSGILDSSCWWLGDWLVFGKEQYSDRYQRGVEAVNLSYQTLRNYAWVARRFPLERRRAQLSFQHHSEIASLPDDEQEQWLDEAEARSWTTKQLRSAVRMAQHNGLSEGDASMKQLAVPGSRVKCWRQAAERAGVAFEQWVLSTLDHAAELELDSESGPPDTQLGNGGEEDGYADRTG
ncbi:LmbU family transcriptional regulator [Kutzneria sp. 744]|uniref:LmbU family transcriptional regulator n=1 Tax=Kutzneria sp. (strain 744) TaxID=345341 RepID=UPI0004B39929|nr:LmbU family transcriptional regulator [Kutzneria sp. 744]